MLVKLVAENMVNRGLQLKPSRVSAAKVTSWSNLWRKILCNGKITASVLKNELIECVNGDSPDRSLCNGLYR